MALIRSLRLTLLLGLLVLVGGIVLSLSANVRLGQPAARDQEATLPPTGGARLEQRASNVQIVRTRAGAPTLRMRAASSRTYTGGRMELSGVTFRLFGPGGQETVIEAPSAESMAASDDAAALASTSPSAGASPGLKETIGSWLMQGGVTVTGADGLILGTPTLAYFEAEGEARTSEPVSFTRGEAIGSSRGMVYDVGPQIARFLQDVTASMPLGSMGLVKVEADSASHDLLRRSFEMLQYQARTARGEVLAGARLVAAFKKGGGIEQLVGDGGFVLESTHTAAAATSPSPLSKLLALEGTRTMRGQRLAVLFGEGPEPVSMEVSGEANLTAGDLKRKGAPSSIAAQTLIFELVDGNLKRARAAGGVDLKGAPAEGESSGFHLRSDHLDAAFDPNLGSILNVEGQGEIHLSDEEMQSQGSRTYLDPNSDIVTLSGEGSDPASATWLGKKIQAQRIEADRKKKTLSARGGVRASYKPPSEPTAEASRTGRALPFFRGGETIHAMAGSLTFADQGKVAHYRDRVRLWQGENRLEAAEIDVNEATGTLEARGDVISSFRQPPPGDSKPGGSPSDDIVTVASASMKYEREANRVLYSSGVLVTQGPMRMTADLVTIMLKEGGGAAERMEAAGHVEMKEQGRTGRGDRLVADLKTDTIKLSGSGREAVVQDESGQQVVRGSSLTMDRSGDRILVESSLGGRTWITLKPRQKGAPGVVSDPHN